MNTLKDFLFLSVSVKRVKEDFQSKSHVFLAVFKEAPQVNGTKTQSERYSKEYAREYKDDGF